MDFGAKRRAGISKTLGEDILLLVVLGAVLIIFQSHVTGTNYCTGAGTYLLKDNYDLNALPVNATSSSPAGQELSNATFWRLVLSTAAHNATNIVQSTVAGLISSDQQWKNWTEQNFSVPPPWLSTSAPGFVLQELASVEQQATSQNGDATAAQGMLKQLVVNDAAGGLTALDFLSFNGLTGLETYFDTRVPSQAFCATFSGQLAQMYMLSFDQSIPIDQRAQYLGELLSITSVMAAVQGAGHFSDNFQAALDKAGLSAAWPSVKPYLASLSDTVSTKASMLAFTVVEKVVQRFPQNSAWTAGLTIDRIQAMADVMKEKGAAVPQIESQISGLVQAAGDAQGPDDVADEADAISFDQYKGIEVKVGSQGQMYLYSAQGTMQIFTADWLQKNVPGFVAYTDCQLRVYYLQDNEILYHLYTGGKNWMATIPSDLANPGNRLTVYISVLTREDFVSTIPPFDLTNDAHFSWLPPSSRVEGFSLDGNALTIKVEQPPSNNGPTSFSLQGNAASSLGWTPGVRSYLQFTVADFSGRLTTLRLYYDGHSAPFLAFPTGQKFAPITLVSSDGVRLRLVYSQPPTHVSTIYVGDPSGGYGLGDLISGGISFNVPGASQVFTVTRVDLLGSREQEMFASSSNYPHGRMGAEIAYAIATQKLGLDHVVLPDPSRGGPDLYTQDGTTVIQARMLTATEAANQQQLIRDLQIELKDMISTLNSNFKDYPPADHGYAILSYADNHRTIRSIVVEVVKP